MKNQLFTIICWCCLSTFSLISCDASKKVTTPKQQAELLLGTWMLENITINNQKFPAETFNGKVVFQFFGDGTTIFSAPNEKSAKAKYSLDKGIITITGNSPKSKLNNLMMIKELTEEVLILTIDIEGQDTDLLLRPEIIP